MPEGSDRDRPHSVRHEQGRKGHKNEGQRKWLRYRKRICKRELR